MCSKCWKLEEASECPHPETNFCQPTTKAIMWHKRHRPTDEQAPAGKRLRDNLVDFYAGGQVPGDRAQSLLEDAGAFAEECGRHELQDVRAHRFPGSARNINRDLRRRLLKKSQWPPIYVEGVRFWSVKSKEMTVKKLAFLLPHEIVAKLQEVGGSEQVLTQASGLDAYNLKRHAEIQQKLEGRFVSLSLWGDGVPFSWDRKRSVDTWTLAFPGLEEKRYRDIRVVLTAMPHECVTRETQDDVLAVLAWSFQALAAGKFPGGRHDGEVWQPEDTWRRQQAGPVLKPRLAI